MWDSFTDRGNEMFAALWNDGWTLFCHICNHMGMNFIPQTICKWMGWDY